MSGHTHYQTLEVNPAATQAEIKSAYRRLAKRFHPDSHHQMANHERIAQVNAAYEVLKDPNRRSVYDQSQTASAGRSTAQTAATTARSQTYHQPTQTARTTEIQLQQWLKQVYNPVNRHLAQILNPLASEIQCLSADPYDDDLMADFQDYLTDCRTRLEAAQRAFQSFPNPGNIASVAAHLYYCINHVEDGIEDLERFTLSYDDSYLTTGRELFRLSKKLRSEVQAAMKAVF
ncbi:DnaJ domain-containing protein [Acaryochloris sp. IP29b_bin.148]|uniref:J domain-containing protein n=1 Tax=Acaryochloris sp. IP29b_bin.148 TaxID=2969218 RepID=UPI0026302DB2|nr:DnaJ domain-containing protein [Acaryochloris sp. IP29b_bin.148]